MHSWQSGATESSFRARVWAVRPAYSVLSLKERTPVSVSASGPCLWNLAAAVSSPFLILNNDRLNPSGGSLRSLSETLSRVDVDLCEGNMKRSDSAHVLPEGTCYLRVELPNFSNNLSTLTSGLCIHSLLVPSDCGSLSRPRCCTFPPLGAVFVWNRPFPLP